MATDTTQLRIFHDFFWTDFMMPQQLGGNLNDWKKYDPTSIAESVAVSSVAPLWFIVGTYDEPSLPGNRTLRNVLLRRGIAHTYIEVPVSHDFAFWTAHAGEAAAWLWGRIKP
jgi:S-formylglutathione hydrolase FrmB